MSFEIVAAPPSSKRARGDEEEAFFTFTIPTTEIRRLCAIPNLGETVSVRVTKSGVKCVTGAETGECENLWDVLPDTVQDRIMDMGKSSQANFQLVNEWALKMGVVKDETKEDDYFGGWSKQSSDNVKKQLTGNDEVKRRFTEAVDNMRNLFGIMFNEGRSEGNNMKPNEYFIEPWEGQSDYQGMNPLPEEGIYYTGYRIDEKETLEKLDKFFQAAVTFLFDGSFENEKPYSSYTFINIYLVWMVYNATSKVREKREFAENSLKAFASGPDRAARLVSVLRFVDEAMDSYEGPMEGTAMHDEELRRGARPSAIAVACRDLVKAVADTFDDKKIPLQLRQCYHLCTGRNSSLQISSNFLN